ncbi:5,10-methenyltetrahydrofolate synthetase [Clostridium algifaecis]|uniref:5,10-methenyltetrahydrofolate synthetase n=2 Tax=Clostridium algifaecis TaxID=1472040 RepID=A0ABS4KNY6_9CLOT|nr:5,10-methenyltetrahydrofolate synthetase [Clostridium algifaecis]
MIAVEIKKFSELVPGAYNILEPESTEFKVDEKSIDLSYIPGVAFDSSGGRIGYGGGYYDRFLQKLEKNSKKIALCYDFQVLDTVPTETHDIMIDSIITN